MHARGGFEQEGLLTRSWSVVVDLVAWRSFCGSRRACTVVGVRAHRRWGWLAIAAGAATFALFTVAL